VYRLYRFCCLRGRGLLAGPDPAVPLHLLHERWLDEVVKLLPRDGDPEDRRQLPVSSVASRSTVRSATKPRARECTYTRHDGHPSSRPSLSGVHTWKM
jgi:hypothetical protein